MDCPIQLTALTFNVQVDFLKVEGVSSWDARKDSAAQCLRGAHPDLIALQELTPAQLAFYAAQLPDFAVVTVREPLTAELKQRALPAYGPNLPDTFNENAILWRRTVFEQVATGHWWLSPTPAVPLSTGFGNIMPRIVIWTRLRHLAAGHTLTVLATHLDNRALLPMAQLCQQQLQALVAPDVPALFLGDFNIDPAEPGYSLLTSNGWQDPYTARTGPPGTVETTFKGRRIDHLFYHGAAITPLEWRRVLSPDPARRISDHDGALA